MAEVAWLVWHHTGTGPARPSVQNTAAYQVGPKAHLQFPSIAYHVYISGLGEAFLCQDLETVTWSQGSGSPYSKGGAGIFNWLGLACCFAGEHPTEAQLAKMREVGDYVDALLGRKLQRLGHREVSVDEQGRALTECPGARLPEWRERVA